MAKGNIRSIRFTDELYELIDRQTGDTFTQKLENLVTRCVWELPAKEKQLKDIQEQIEKEKQDLKYIQHLRFKLEKNLRDINCTIENTVNQVKRISKNLEEVNT